MVSTLLILTACFLLALVAGLLLVVVGQLRSWKREAARMPLLGEALASQLMHARTGLETLKQQAQEVLPKLTDSLNNAQKATQDLEYLNAHAERLFVNLEKQTNQMKQAPDPAVIASDYGLLGAEIAQVNQGSSALLTEPMRTPDPLEQLLANLAQSELVKPQTNPQASQSITNNVVKLNTPSKAKPPRTATQAELELKKGLLG